MEFINIFLKKTMSIWSDKLSSNQTFFFKSFLISILCSNYLGIAKSQPIKKYDDQTISSYSIQSFQKSNIEELFDEAFYMHTRPYFQNNDLLAKTRELLNISLGGKNKISFIGLGYREKTIEWDGNALENTYKKVLNMHTKDYLQQGSDIPNGFGNSLLNTK